MTLRRHSTADGYVKVGDPAGIRGMLYEHRLVMELHIGRPLLEAEVVHHIDQKRDNNRIDNLLLMDQDGHTLIHLALDEVREAQYRPHDVRPHLAGQRIEAAIAAGRRRMTEEVRLNGTTVWI